ncbi:hypothetical protein NPIL_307181, partial [Nephila pilipes]
AGSLGGRKKGWVRFWVNLLALSIIHGPGYPLKARGKNNEEQEGGWKRVNIRKKSHKENGNGIFLGGMQYERMCFD